jgi:hypothetical protein
MQIAIFIGIQTEHAANDRFAAVILAHSSTGFEPPAAGRSGFIGVYALG